MGKTELAEAAARNRARLADSQEHKPPFMYSPDKPCSRCGGYSRFTHNNACSICFQNKLTKLHGEIS